MRGFFEKTFRSISTPFGNIFEHDYERQRSSGAFKQPILRKARSHLSDTDIAEAGACVEAQKQTSDTGSLSVDTHEKLSDVSPANAEITDDETDRVSRQPQFVEGPDRIVAIHEGDTRSLLFGLTTETVGQILEMIRASRAFKPIEENLNDLRETVDIDQARLGALRCDLEDPTTPASEKQEISERLQEREMVLERNIERMQDLQMEFDSREIRLKVLRDGSQKMFEKVLTEAGLLEPPRTEIPAMEVDEKSANSEVIGYSPASPMAGPEDVALHPEEFGTFATVESERAEAVAARKQYLEASNWARDAEQQFMERQQVYEQDIQEYGSTASRTEIDLFHVQRGRDLARNLDAAEEAWEKARAQAKALGVLSNNSYQSSNFVDDVDDGYRLSQDQSGQAIKPNHRTIEAWAERIVQPETEGDHQSMPDVDDWEGGSIGPSDSLSVYAEGRQRVRIDRWRSVCETIQSEDWEP